MTLLLHLYPCFMLVLQQQEINYEAISWQCEAGTHWSAVLVFRVSEAVPAWARPNDGGEVRAIEQRVLWPTNTRRVVVRLLIAEGPPLRPNIYHPAQKQEHMNYITRFQRLQTCLKCRSCSPITGPPLCSIYGSHSVQAQDPWCTQQSLLSTLNYYL